MHLIKLILFAALIPLAIGQVHGQTSSLHPVADKGDDTQRNYQLARSQNQVRALKVLQLQAEHVDSMQFNISGLPGICTLDIFDESGTVQRSLTTEDENHIVLTIGDLPSGPYFVRARPIIENGIVYTAYLLNPQ